MAAKTARENASAPARQTQSIFFPRSHQKKNQTNPPLLNYSLPHPRREGIQVSAPNPALSSPIAGVSPVPSNSELGGGGWRGRAPAVRRNFLAGGRAEGNMYVVKRDGRQEAVHFDKITARLKKLSYGLSQEHCDPVLVAQKVCAGVYKGVTTSQLDELAAETAAAMTASHPDYALVRKPPPNPRPGFSSLPWLSLTRGWLLPPFLCRGS